jgi:phosphatidate cytidylyltransferase
MSGGGKSKSEMVSRTVLGLAMALLLIGVLIWGEIPLLLFVALVAGIGIREFFHVARVPGFTIMGVVSVEVLISFSFIGYHWPQSVHTPAGYMSGLGTTALIVGLLAMLLIQVAVRRPHFNLADLGIMVFGICYVGGILSLAFPLMALVRDAYPNSLYLPRLGLLLPIWAASGSDTFAYFTGSLFGRRPFFPELSPRKTWEGLIGGFVLATFGMAAICVYMGFHWCHAVALAALACAAAPLGDLAESAIKREFAAKDAGSILGPMGGVMDRIDSLLFTLPVVYFYLLIAKPFS